MSQTSPIVSYTTIRTANAGAPRTAPPFYASWTNHISQSFVRSIAVHPITNHIWLVGTAGVRVVDPSNLEYWRYGSEHGLPGNTIASLAIDAAGRVWVAGAEGGLAYFDNERWKPYPTQKMYGDLVTLPVRVMCPAYDTGGIIVATDSSLYRLAAPDENAIPVGISDVCARAYALALLHDIDGLLIGNATGLYRISERGASKRIAEDKLDSCVAILRNATGLLYAASRKSVCSIRHDIAEEIIALDYDLRFSHVLALAATPSRLWILASTGIYAYEGGSCVAIGSPDDSPFQVMAIAPALRGPGGVPREDFLWVGGSNTDGDGFGGILTGARPLNERVQTASRRAKDQWKVNILTPHRDDQVPILHTRCLAGPDAEGALWVGTEQGLFRRNSHEWLTTSDGSVRWLMNDIRALHIDRYRRIWILAYPQGVLCLENGKFRSYPLPGIPTCLTLGDNGQAYCSTGSGVLRLDRTGWTQIAYGMPDRVTALAVIREGLWLGTVSSLYRYSSQGWELMHRAGWLPERQCAIHCILPQTDGLMLGTELGIWQLRDGERREHSLPGRASKNVIALAQSNGERIWLASGGSIMRYKMNDGSIDIKWTPINSGLGGKHVRAMLEYDDCLWIATTAGLSQANLHIPERQTADEGC